MKASAKHNSLDLVKIALNVSNQAAISTNEKIASFNEDRDLLAISFATAMTVDKAIEKDNAYGVYECRFEVVLCAGVFSSPLMLLRSGFGPEKHLKEVGKLFS